MKLSDFIKRGDGSGAPLVIADSIEAFDGEETLAAFDGEDQNSDGTTNDAEQTNL